MTNPQTLTQAYSQYRGVEFRGPQGTPQESRVNVSHCVDIIIIIIIIIITLRLCGSTANFFVVWIIGLARDISSRSFWVYIYIYIYVLIYSFTYLYIHIFILLHRGLSLSLYIYIYIHTYHTYIHIYTHNIVIVYIIYTMRSMGCGLVSILRIVISTLE